MTILIRTRQWNFLNALFNVLMIFLQFHCHSSDWFIKIKKSPLYLYSTPHYNNGGFFLTTKGIQQEFLPAIVVFCGESSIAIFMLVNLYFIPLAETTLLLHSPSNINLMPVPHSYSDFMPFHIIFSFFSSGKRSTSYLLISKIIVWYYFLKLQFVLLVMYLTMLLNHFLYILLHWYFLDF